MLLICVCVAAAIVTAWLCRGRIARLIGSAGGGRGGNDADISVTIMQVMALRAAKSAGIHVKDETMKKAITYIKRCYDPRSGGFSYMPGTGPGFARTAAGVCVLQLTGEYKAKEIPHATLGPSYPFSSTERCVNGQCGPSLSSVNVRSPRATLKPICLVAASRRKAAFTVSHNAVYSTPPTIAGPVFTPAPIRSGAGKGQGGEGEHASSRRQHGLSLHHAPPLRIKHNPEVTRDAPEWGLLRFHRERGAETILRDLNDLKIGAPVVHVAHGVGRYLGLVKLDAGGIDAEYLVLEYADGDELYVPVASLNQIHRYTGAAAEAAPLHALGYGVDGPNGVYAYGVAAQFPASDGFGQNYWADIVVGSGGSVMSIEYIRLGGKVVAIENRTGH